jgi:hypothetical protein
MGRAALIPEKSMYRAVAIAGGVLAALGLCDLAVAVGKSPLGAGLQAVFVPARAAAAVDRASKGDRLPLPVNSGELISIATVEVVGLDAAAIVYRDRDGRVLFRTDPVANVTVVAKGVRLPQVTIRERRDEPTQPVPIEMPNDGRERPRLEGCDPLVSPLAAPSVAGLTGKCLSSAAPVQVFASLDF